MAPPKHETIVSLIATFAAAVGVGIFVVFILVWLPSAVVRHDHHEDEKIIEEPLKRFYEKK
jgi:hypothetical protein